MDFVHVKNQIALYDADKKIIAEVTFPDIDEATVNVNHTFVDDSLRGQGVAGKLMTELAGELRSQKKQAVLTCSYAEHWFAHHKDEYADILR